MVAGLSRSQPLLFFHCCKLEETHGHLSASVIVISSMSGTMRHAQGHFGCNAAKGATVHLSKLMSYEFKESGIRVNSIEPGYFPSRMTTKERDSNQKSTLLEEKIKEKGYVPIMIGVGRGDGTRHNFLDREQVNIGRPGKLRCINTNTKKRCARGVSQHSK
ncbi:hypothetical protein L207DRAFT_619271 [Hyaloscypha variabilis F]|uniref:NAD(P)-binding protein n=1 Tax=Hyaloscypha variabilis (strain UAMH 11265 / GT02V1 / F) TaxID=1149755 RepID=A0A2J6S0M6_HYAVF|nr:hypothetical protein L207DRAFT_619271 [Hyaloscypha variabilis F]